MSEENDKAPIAQKGFFDYNPQQWKEFAETIGEQFRKYQESKSKGERRIAYPIFVLVTLVFVTTSVLTWSSTIGPEAFLILGGTIIGYLMSFLVDYIVPTE